MVAGLNSPSGAFAARIRGVCCASAFGGFSGPKYFNTDVALLKVLNVTNRIGLQARAEFFNIFNNVNFNAPNSNVSSAQFGRIITALDPRILQFGVKLLF